MILFGLARRTARQIEKVSLFYIIVGPVDTVGSEAPHCAERVGRAARAGVAARAVECVLLVAFARHEAGDDRQSGKPVGPPKSVALPACETELAADDVCSVIVIPCVVTAAGT